MMTMKMSQLPQEIKPPDPVIKLLLVMMMVSLSSFKFLLKKLIEILTQMMMTTKIILNQFLMDSWEMMMVR